MKRIILALFLLIFSVQAAYADMPPEIPVQTQDAYSINTSLPVDEYLIGDEVYVNLEIDTEEVRGFEIIFEYDKDFLEFKSVGVDIIGVSENENIEIKQIEDNNVLYAVTTIGENTIDASKKLCTVNFKALKNGKTSFSLKSAKVVFDDMKYYINSSLENTLEIKLGKEEVKKPLGGGGGGGGGGFYVKPKPKEEVEEVIEDIPVDTDENEETEPALNFTDVKDDFWGYKEISHLVKEDIINGYEDNSFKPDRHITRAEFAKILVMATELDTSANFENIFTDVELTDWFADFVLSAAKHKIFLGDENNCFNPDEYITREDAATALSRYITENNHDIPKTREEALFTDFELISDYASEHIGYLYEIGIVNGDNNCFYPKNNITRAEAAAMIYRMVVR